MSQSDREGAWEIDKSFKENFKAKKNTCGDLSMRRILLLRKVLLFEWRYICQNKRRRNHIGEVISWKYECYEDLWKDVLGLVWKMLSYYYFMCIKSFDNKQRNLSLLGRFSIESLKWIID